jgi:hypothetical protein
MFLSAMMDYVKAQMSIHLLAYASAEISVHLLDYVTAQIVNPLA